MLDKIKEYFYSAIGVIVSVPFLVFYLVAGEEPNEEYATNLNDDIVEQDDEM